MELSSLVARVLSEIKQFQNQIELPYHLSEPLKALSWPLKYMWDRAHKSIVAIGKVV